jgi:spore maturation protein CgeB
MPMPRDGFLWPTIQRTVARVPVLAALNQRVKSRQTVAHYRASCAYYASRPMPSDARRPLRERLARQGFAGQRRPRVFFVGTDEQQDKSGLLQALERLADTRWFVKADGSYGHNDPRAVAVRRAANAELLWRQLSDCAEQGWVPDLVLAQTWASLIDAAVFSRVREQWGSLVASLAMDDRHQYWGGSVGGMGTGTRALIPHIDLALTAAPECVDWYEKEGCPALFFPEASDAALFRPMPDLPKVHDVSFVGARYGIREQLVTALRSAGIRVSAYGSGWEAGRLANEAVPQLFAQSKIVLGVGTIGYCDDFYALKLRDFDAPMSGSLYLTHANPDLDSLFDVGREIATYRDTQDCVDRARHLLSAAEAETREQIARAGRARACADHTWERRFGRLFAALGADEASQSLSCGATDADRD